MMPHLFSIRATLRQAGWVPFAGSMDARSGAGAVRDSTGGDCP